MSKKSRRKKKGGSAADAALTPTRAIVVRPDCGDETSCTWIYRVTCKNGWYPYEFKRNKWIVQ